MTSSLLRLRRSRCCSITCRADGRDYYTLDGTVTVSCGSGDEDGDEDASATRTRTGDPCTCWMWENGCRPLRRREDAWTPRWIVGYDLWTCDHFGGCEVEDGDEDEDGDVRTSARTDSSRATTAANAVPVCGARRDGQRATCGGNLHVDETQAGSGDGDDDASTAPATPRGRGVRSAHVAVSGAGL